MGAVQRQATDADGRKVPRQRDLRDPASVLKLDKCSQEFSVEVIVFFLVLGIRQYETTKSDGWAVTAYLSVLCFLTFASNFSLI
jgi:hypothetical protein